ncbi:TPA: ORF6N domain-containing protein [Escherichia coli]|uniref:ORF6N domain-containing protein n=1 Tax=Escherichia coli TaxID=562 RepID=UPI0018209872|nr:ORF6N domain-containing protein [Escherichia coli]EFD4952396.1 ORF6N domain-containing protein [Escherichia coli]EFE8013429.1 ORF6N domain-containing protein [Escherichia coli]MBS9066445.1 ORF6N domain-containing protein [Escherichia coli]HAV8139641.1 ORF6N domain-containing protein [Escherichia coli]HAW7447425.1 ORF6N domain-containing protein [Escherichia coli]
MTTQISVETLSPITHNQIPVITTELLAQLYGTEAIRIQQNHKRNSDRFVEGKHFFKIVGEELKNLRLSLRESQISPKTRSLILWTERGAARHAKMLETDQAWEVFEKLEDCYFNKKQPPASPQTTSVAGCSLLIHFNSHGQVEFTEKVPADAMVCTLERFKFYLEQQGWIVARKEQLLERLMSL